MKIIVDVEKCTGCKICTKVCPQQILEVVDKKMRVKDIDHCMGCFGCEDECKEGAVRLLRAPQSVKDIKIESAPENLTECDVAIVGAGPAGLGAAITCAKAGLDTVVFERLPNRKISHHTDGGVLLTMPWMTSIEIDEQTVSFPELDISISADFTKRCEYLGILGPDGLSTKSKVPDNIKSWAGNKDGFVEALINEAEKAGAKIWFNAKVVDVIKDGDKVAGVRLHTGEEIKSKVVVTADGVFAKISEKAGFDINKDDMWFGSVLAYEYENTENFPGGLFYLNGEMRFEEDMPPVFGGVGVTEVIHIIVAIFYRKKFYTAPKPLYHYLDLLIEKDKRIKERLGDFLLRAKPKMITGCRAVMRAKSNAEVAGNGVISIGDAWVDDGELGNVPSLANGVFAGKVIVEAAKKNDFSKEALRPANDFINKKLLKMLSKNKDFKLLPAQLTEEELKQMFLFMQHMNYPIMLLGSPLQQGLMFTNFMIRNFFRFFKYPKIRKLLF